MSCLWWRVCCLPFVFVWCWLLCDASCLAFVYVCFASGGMRYLCVVCLLYVVCCLMRVVGC